MIQTGPLYAAAQLAWAIPRAISSGDHAEAYTKAADLYMVADDPRYVIASIVDWALGAALLLGDGGPLVIDHVYAQDGSEIQVVDAAPEVALTSRLIVMASCGHTEEAAECLMLTDNTLLHMVFMEMALAFGELLRGNYLNPN